MRRCEAFVPTSNEVFSVSLSLHWEDFKWTRKDGLSLIAIQLAGHSAISILTLYIWHLNFWCIDRILGSPSRLLMIQAEGNLKKKYARLIRAPNRLGSLGSSWAMEITTKHENLWGERNFLCSSLWSQVELAQSVLFSTYNEVKWEKRETNPPSDCIHFVSIQWRSPRRQGLASEEYQNRAEPNRIELLACLIGQMDCCIRADVTGLYVTPWDPSEAECKKFNFSRMWVQPLGFRRTAQRFTCCAKTSFREFPSLGFPSAPNDGNISDSEVRDNLIDDYEFFRSAEHLYWPFQSEVQVRASIWRAHLYPCLVFCPRLAIGTLWELKRPTYWNGIILLRCQMSTKIDGKNFISLRLPLWENPRQ